ncbi:MAG: C_GCAxxG_C_C family protein [Chloroflexi bacterium]|nr:C_GCAxxG_C_C family protein [Chloroflexota bacterium]
MEEQTDKQPRRDLQARIESYLAEGWQCSQCVLLVLQDVTAVGNEPVTRAARTLGRGMGGSGNVCGALAAGMLALGLESSPKLGEDDPLPGVATRLSQTAIPLNDFLDVFRPIEPPVFAQCRELRVRFGAELPKAVGSLDCRAISRVNWSRPSEEDLSRYYAPNGGMARCVNLIAKATEIVIDLVGRQKRQAS